MLDILARAGCYVGIIVLGWFLRKKEFFGPDAFGTLSKIVIRITLPAAIISNCSGKSLNPALLVLALLGLGGGCLYMAAAWLLSRGQSREDRVFALVNTTGYNVGNFSTPFIQSFLGPMGMVATSIFDIGNCFICMGGSYGLGRSLLHGGKLNVGKILKEPLKIPPFLTYLLMAILNLLGWTLPKPVLTFAEIVGSANAFLAMLVIGIGFQLSGDQSQFKTIARVLVPRYAIAAVLALCYYYLLPFDLVVRQTLVILAFSPIGSATPVFTRQLGCDAGLSSAINSIAIVISITVIVVLLMVM